MIVSTSIAMPADGMLVTMSGDSPCCVRCGGTIEPSATACDDCGWPFTPGAWTTFERRPLRITLDTGCINVKRQNEDLNLLESWAEDGRLVLQRADAMLSEIKGEERVAKATAMPGHPELFTLGVSTLDRGDVLAGPDMGAEIRKILFPTTATLTSNQRHDVEHLRAHVRTGGDVFVTLNLNDFLTEGRQVRLRSMGIWVMLPAELTSLLGSAFGWT
jgi:hypothetical protein